MSDTKEWWCGMCANLETATKTSCTKCGSLPSAHTLRNMLHEARAELKQARDERDDAQRASRHESDLCAQALEDRAALESQLVQTREEQDRLLRTVSNTPLVPKDDYVALESQLVQAREERDEARGDRWRIRGEADEYVKQLAALDTRAEGLAAATAGRCADCAQGEAPVFVAGAWRHKTPQCPLSPEQRAALTAWQEHKAKA